VRQIIFKEFCMKNTIKVLGIIALVAVIGFAFIACDDGSKDDNGGGGGTFTLTNIPSEYNGKYMYIQIDTYNTSAEWAYGTVDEDGSQYYFARISNGRASIPMWTSSDGWTTLVRYTRTETVPCEGFIINADGISGMVGGGIKFSFNSVSFTNGNATKSWNDIDRFE
jgi:hypothetical protein